MKYASSIILYSNSDCFFSSLYVVHMTIFGTAPSKTLTMVEGILFPPDKVPQFKLESVDKLDDEVVLRYRSP